MEIMSMAKLMEILNSVVIYVCVYIYLYLYIYTLPAIDSWGSWFLFQKLSVDVMCVCVCVCVCFFFFFLIPSRLLLQS